MERPLLLHSTSIRKGYKNGGIVEKETKGAAKRIKCLQIDSLQAPGEMFKATKRETQGKCMTGIKKRALGKSKRKRSQQNSGMREVVRKEKLKSCSNTENRKDNKLGLTKYETQ